MDRVELESFWLSCPDFADVFVWCEALESLEPLGEIVGQHEVIEVAAKLRVFAATAHLRAAADGRFLDQRMSSGYNQPSRRFSHGGQSMTVRELVRWFADQDVAALSAMAVSVGVFVLFMVRVPAVRETAATEKAARG